MDINITIQGADEFQEKLRNAKDFIDNDATTIIGIEAKNHFRESFLNEGFTDKSLDKWASRKSKRLDKNDSKLLTYSGELGDSIDFRVEGDTVIISSDKQYAQIHNEGGIITVTDKMKKFFWAKHYEAAEAGADDIASQFKNLALAKQIKIEKRQFIGNSEVLNQAITNKLSRELDKIFKSL